MKKTAIIIDVLFITTLLLNTGTIIAQDKIGWLAEYTTEINAGSYSYLYNFYATDNNTCKLKIEELKTDKKGKTSTTGYLFYLSDINPSSLSFKPSGSIIIVNMETKLSQKFISIFTEGAFEGYTNEISVNMNEVGKARSFIEALKSNISTCKKTDLAWTSREEVFTWLGKNIGESSSSGATYKQEFSNGEKSYLAQLKTETVDSKGNQQTDLNIFDLSDINPDGISLIVSGKSLKIELPVRDNKNYIQVKKGEEGITFSKDVEVYVDDIEIARNIVNAFNFLVSDTHPERKQWKSYTEALTYVKENLKEVSVGSAKFAQSFSFGVSPSDLVYLKSLETDSKGASSEYESSFYLNDLSPVASLNVSSTSAYLNLETKNENKYIKQTLEGKIQPFSSSLKIYVNSIDEARDLKNALEYAVNNSISGIQEYVSLEKTIEWLSQSLGEVTIDTKNTRQTLKISPGLENKLELYVVTTDESSSINERFEIYPEDLSVEDIKIKVSGKKLYVPLSDGKLKYVKVYKENEIQNYVTNAEVLFEDVKKAKNFVSALNFLHEKSIVENRMMKDKAAALAYLAEQLRKVEIAGVVYDQKIEKQDEDDCKLKFTCTVTDSKGAATEYIFEFILSDIDPANSDISVSAKELTVNLITKEKQKLVKIYKNGEAGNFDYDVDIYVDDVLIAKKILAAFATLSNACK